MFLFRRKTSIMAGGLLRGLTDCHSHVLPGVDDGSPSMEKSLEILRFMEDQGVAELWLTPHVMEDVRNTTEGLQARFSELCAAYNGTVRLNLAAEYMLDSLYEDRLEAHDLLTHSGDELVLVETSAIVPPVNLWGLLEKTMHEGYRPLIAHPERYSYMTMADYDRLRAMGCRMQLNLPSLAGHYGPHVQKRAVALLQGGCYSMVGSDCHRLGSWQHSCEATELRSGTVDLLRQLLQA